MLRHMTSRVRCVSDDLRVSQSASGPARVCVCVCVCDGRHGA